ncbi:MAG: glutamate N-acetyltransferase/amino-acid N-acetyltransferase [Methylophagaceae bacterium]|jgi:glutamate N-acetyltransferase/amino-acid N-acetyltransferase
MAVNLPVLQAGQLLAIDGIRLATASAGIKNNDRTDLVLIEIAKGSSVSAVYTQNAFCAAPVTIAKQHQKVTGPRYCLINSGNANAGTGRQGDEAATNCCRLLAEQLNVVTECVLPFSTGVIGQQLPVEKIQAALPDLISTLTSDNWFNAAHGIMTTDTLAKAISQKVMVDGVSITITGMAKGSGMIRPDMATMLSYIATDANVSQGLLDKMLKQAAAQSFNRISVDGDTSTNDACVLIATGQADNAALTDFDSEAAQKLYKAIAKVSQYLAHAIVRDGEGATKFIEVTVEQGQNTAECRQVAYTIAHSPLVKTAFFASDPNWGRILAAVGRSGLQDFDLSKVAIYLDDICIIRAGEPAAEYTEPKGQDVMDNAEITIRVMLERGEAIESVWTCDFSYDYVKINAEYRS